MSVGLRFITGSFTVSVSGSTALSAERGPDPLSARDPMVFLARTALLDLFDLNCKQRWTRTWLV